MKKQIKKLSLYTCPHCGNSDTDSPALRDKVCGMHSKRVIMIEKTKGVVTK